MFTVESEGANELDIITFGRAFCPRVIDSYDPSQLPGTFALISRENDKIAQPIDGYACDDSRDATKTVVEIPNDAQGATSVTVDGEVPTALVQ